MAKHRLDSVWKFETGEQDYAAESLGLIANLALEGDIKLRNYLRKLWDGESWNSIKRKLETEGRNSTGNESVVAFEGSTWYVWWMDGVNAHLNNLRKEKRKGEIEK